METGQTRLNFSIIFLKHDRVSEIEKMYLKIFLKKFDGEVLDGKVQINIAFVNNMLKY